MAEPLVQEGRRDRAGGKREDSLYSKLFNLFGLVGYFCRAALAFIKMQPPKNGGWHSQTYG
jgi:hypothetical protein